MDPRVMELRIKKWIPLIEEQAKSGMTKDEWCALHGIERTSFFRWQKRVREYGEVKVRSRSIGKRYLIPVLRYQA